MKKGKEESCNNNTLDYLLISVRLSVLREVILKMVESIFPNNVILNIAKSFQFQNKQIIKSSMIEIRIIKDKKKDKKNNDIFFVVVVFISIWICPNIQEYSYINSV